MAEGHGPAHRLINGERRIIGRLFLFRGGQGTGSLEIYKCQIRRYAPVFLEAPQMKAAPAARDILTAVETLKALDADNTRTVPTDAPTSFVRKRWESLVFTDAGVDRRFYELCTLSELRNALRSGDIGNAPIGAQPVPVQWTLLEGLGPRCPIVPRRDPAGKAVPSSP